MGKDEGLGWHAIHDAAETGDTGDIQTPLHRAAVSGSTLLVRLLLLHGGDPNLADEAGKTPRDLAEEGGFSMAVRLLAPIDRPGPA